MSNDLDTHWFRAKCDANYIPANADKEHDFIERVGMKNDSGTSLEDSRNEAWKECFA